MDTSTLFLKALDQATTVIGCVKNEHFEAPTPCDEWNMRQLVNHLLYELSWVPDLVDGKTIAEVGNKYEGDLIGQDLVASWQAAAEHGREAIKRLKPGSMIHLSYGDVPAEEYLIDISNDLAIHAWDIDQGLNCSLRIDEDIVRLLHDKAAAGQDSSDSRSVLSKTGTLDQGANLQQKLLALTGRPSEKWEVHVSQIA